MADLSVATAGWNSATKPVCVVVTYLDAVGYGFEMGKVLLYHKQEIAGRDRTAPAH